MATSLFDQFISPVLLGIPLIALAFVLPWLLFPAPAHRWITNRLLTLQNSFVGTFTAQLLKPLNMGGHKWALILAALMLFLMSLNMLGLLPYTFTPTAQLSVNLGLAVPLWLATVLIGMRNQPTKSLAHFLPEGTPIPLIPILIIIETISLFIRPVALGVRLTAQPNSWSFTYAPNFPQLPTPSYAWYQLWQSSQQLYFSCLQSSKLLLLSSQAYVFVLLLKPVSSTKR
uniref:ATP synthase subunit a n=1 Tax=Taenioides cirratus TaxID=508012 RepID=A0A139Z3M6_9GOBI|nr:ATP synthase F0 subunit 6 [Taenioides cirratus]